MRDLSHTTHVRERHGAGQFPESCIRCEYDRPLPDFSSEAELRAFVVPRLANLGFAVHEEVWGTHWSGKRLRVDAVANPPQAERWAEADTAFAVEFKIAAWRSVDFRRFSRWHAQMLDYAQTRWDDFGYLPVLACPRLLPDTPEWVESRWTLCHELWALGHIGELCPRPYHGWTIQAAESHVLWSEKAGVHEGRRWRLHPSWGSR